MNDSGRISPTGSASPPPPVSSQLGRFDRRVSDVADPILKRYNVEMFSGPATMHLEKTAGRKFELLRKGDQTQQAAKAAEVLIKYALATLGRQVESPPNPHAPAAMRSFLPRVRLHDLGGNRYQIEIMQSEGRPSLKLDLTEGAPLQGPEELSDELWREARAALQTTGLMVPANRAHWIAQQIFRGREAREKGVPPAEAESVPLVSSEPLLADAAAAGGAAEPARRPQRPGIQGPSRRFGRDNHLKRLQSRVANLDGAVRSLRRQVRSSGAELERSLDGFRRDVLGMLGDIGRERADLARAAEDARADANAARLELAMVASSSETDRLELERRAAAAEERERAALEALSAMASASTQNIAALQDALQSLSTELESATTRLGVADAEAAELLCSNETLRQTLDTLSAELAALRQETEQTIAQLQEQLAGQKEQLQTLRGARRNERVRWSKRIKALTTSIANLKLRLKNRLLLTTALRKQLADRDRKLAAQANRLGELGQLPQELASLREELDAARTEAADAASRQAAAEAELQEQRLRMDAALEEVRRSSAASVQRAEAERDEAVQANQTAVDGLRDLEVRFFALNAASEEWIKAFEGRLTAADQAVERVGTENQRLKEALIATQNELETKKSDLARAEDRVTELDRQAQGSQKRIAELEAELGRVEEEKEDLLVQAAIAEREIQSKARALDAFRDKSRQALQAANQARRAAQQQVYTLRAEVDRLGTQKNELEGRVSSTTAQLTTLTTQQGQLRAELEALQTANSALQAELEQTRAAQAQRIQHALNSLAEGISDLKVRLEQNDRFVPSETETAIRGAADEADSLFSQIEASRRAFDQARSSYNEAVDNVLNALTAWEELTPDQRRGGARTAVKDGLKDVAEARETLEREERALKEALSSAHSTTEVALRQVNEGLKAATDLRNVLAPDSRELDLLAGRLAELTQAAEASGVADAVRNAQEDLDELRRTHDARLSACTDRQQALQATATRMNGRQADLIRQAQQAFPVGEGPDRGTLEQVTSKLSMIAAQDAAAAAQQLLEETLQAKEALETQLTEATGEREANHARIAELKRALQAERAKTAELLAAKAQHLGTIEAQAAEIGLARMHVSTARQATAAVTTKLASAERDLASVRDLLDNVTGDKDRLSEQVDRLQTDLVAAQTQAEKAAVTAQQQTAKKQDEINRLKTQVTQAAKKLTSQQQEFETASERLLHASAENQHSLQLTIDSLRSETHASQARVRELETQLQAAIDERAALQSEKANSQARSDQVIEDQRNKIASLTAEKTALENQIPVLRDRITTLEKVLSVKETTLEDTLRKARTTQEKLTADVSAASEQARLALAERDQVVSQIAALREQLAAQEGAATAQAQQLQSLTSQKDGLESEVKRLRDESAEVQRRTAAESQAITSQLRKAETGLTTQSQELDDLKAQVRTVQAEAAQAASRASSERASLASELAHVRTNLESTASELQAANAAKDAAEAAKASVEQERDRISQELRASQASNSTLIAALEKFSTTQNELITRSASQIQNLRERLPSLQEAVKEARARAAQAHQALDNARREASEATSRAEQAEARATQAEQALLEAQAARDTDTAQAQQAAAAARAEADRLHQQLAEKGQSLRAAQTQAVEAATAFETERARFDAELATARSLISTEQTRSASLEEELSKAHATLQETLAHNETLTSHLQSARDAQTAKQTELDSSLAQLEQQLRDAAGLAETAKAEATQLQAILVSAQAEQARLTSELSKSSEELSAARTELITAQSEITDLQKTLETKTSELEQLQASRAEEQEQTRLARLRQTLHIILLTARCTFLLNERVQSATQLAEQDKRNRELEGAQAELRQGIAGILAQSSNLINEDAANDALLNALQTQTSDLRSAVEQNQAANQSLEATLREERERGVQESGRVRAEADAAATRQSELAATLADRDQQISSLTNTRIEQEAKITELTTQIRELTAQIAMQQETVFGERSRLKGELASQREAAKRSDEALQVAEAKLHAAATREMELTTSLARAEAAGKEQQEQLTAQLEAVTAEKAAAEKDAAAARLGLSRTEEKLLSLRTAFSELTTATVSTLEGYEARISELNTAIETIQQQQRSTQEDLKRELESERSATTTLAAERNALRAELTAAESTIGAIRQAQTEAEATNARLTQELENARSAAKEASEAHEAAINELDRRAADLTSALGAANMAATQRQQELSTKLAALQAQLQKSEDRRVKLDSTLLLKEIELTNAVSARQVAEQALQESRSSNTELQMALNQAVHDAASRVKAAEADLAGVRASSLAAAEQAKLEISSLIEEKKRVSDDLEALKAELSTTTQALESARSEASISRGLSESLQSKLESSAADWEATRKSLEERIQSLKEEMGAARLAAQRAEEENSTQIALLQQTLAKSEADLAHSRTTLQGVEQQVKTLNEELELLRSEKAALAQQASSLERSLEASKKERADQVRTLNAELQRRQETIDSLQATIARQGERLQNLEADLTSSAELLRTTKAENAGLSRTVNELRAALERLKLASEEEKVALSNQIRTAEERYEAAQIQLAAQSTEIVDAKKRVEELSIANSSLNSKLEAQRSLYAQLQGDLEAAQTRVSNLEEQLTQTDRANSEAVQRLTQEIETATQEHDRLKEELGAQRDQLAATLQELDVFRTEASTEIERLESSLRSTQAELGLSEAARRDLQTRLDRLLCQASDARAGKQQLLGEAILELELRLRAWTSDQETARQALETAAPTRENLSKRLNNLQGRQTKLESAIQELNEALSRASQLKAQVQEANVIPDKLSSARDSLSQSTDELRKLLENQASLQSDIDWAAVELQSLIGEEAALSALLERPQPILPDLSQFTPPQALPPNESAASDRLTAIQTAADESISAMTARRDELTERLETEAQQLVELAEAQRELERGEQALRRAVTPNDQTAGVVRASEDLLGRLKTNRDRLQNPELELNELQTALLSADTELKRAQLQIESLKQIQHQPTVVGAIERFASPQATSEPPSEELPAISAIPAATGLEGALNAVIDPLDTELARTTQRGDELANLVKTLEASLQAQKAYLNALQERAASYDYELCMNGNSRGWLVPLRIGSQPRLQQLRDKLESVVRNGSETLGNQLNALLALGELGASADRLREAAPILTKALNLKRGDRFYPLAQAVLGGPLASSDVQQTLASGLRQERVFHLKENIRQTILGDWASRERDYDQLPTTAKKPSDESLDRLYEAQAILKKAREGNTLATSSLQNLPTSEDDLKALLDQPSLQHRSPPIQTLQEFTEYLKNTVAAGFRPGTNWGSQLPAADRPKGTDAFQAIQRLAEAVCQRFDQLVAEEAEALVDREPIPSAGRVELPLSKISQEAENQRLTGAPRQAQVEAANKYAAELLAKILGEPQEPQDGEALLLLVRDFFEREIQHPFIARYFGSPEAQNLLWKLITLYQSSVTPASQAEAPLPSFRDLDDLGAAVLERFQGHSRESVKPQAQVLQQTRVLQNLYRASRATSLLGAPLRADQINAMREIEAAWAENRPYSLTWGTGTGKTTLLSCLVQFENLMTNDPGRRVLFSPFMVDVMAPGLEVQIFNEPRGTRQIEGPTRPAVALDEAQLALPRTAGDFDVAARFRYGQEELRVIQLTATPTSNEDARKATETYLDQAIQICDREMGVINTELESLQEPDRIQALIDHLPDLTGLATPPRGVKTDRAHPYPEQELSQLEGWRSQPEKNLEWLNKKIPIHGHTPAVTDACGMIRDRLANIIVKNEGAASALLQEKINALDNLRIFLVAIKRAIASRSSEQSSTPRTPRASTRLESLRSPSTPRSPRLPPTPRAREEAASSSAAASASPDAVLDAIHLEADRIRQKRLELKSALDFILHQQRRLQTARADMSGMPPVSKTFEVLKEKAQFEQRAVTTLGNTPWSAAVQQLFPAPSENVGLLVLPHIRSTEETQQQIAEGLLQAGHEVERVVMIRPGVFEGKQRYIVFRRAANGTTSATSMSLEELERDSSRSARTILVYDWHTKQGGDFGTLSQQPLHPGMRLLVLDHVREPGDNSQLAEADCVQILGRPRRPPGWQTHPVADLGTFWTAKSRDAFLEGAREAQSVLELYSSWRSIVDRYAPWDPREQKALVDQVAAALQQQQEALEANRHELANIMSLSQRKQKLLETSLAIQHLKSQQGLWASLQQAVTELRSGERAGSPSSSSASDASSSASPPS